ncbi:hypothetical protein SNE40_010656 [Patella caerulea]|uniref:Suppressor of cytokine signaling 5 n=2 Tax=Patella caerulea TaxID=87958 RepID=A0AAN8PRV7_PATCE
MASAENSEIEILESSESQKEKLFSSLDETTGNNNSLPVKHRMHRSAVRPFFCCGSEISLVSLVDNTDKENNSQSVDTEKSLEITGEEDSQDSLLPKNKSGSSKCSECNGVCSGCRRQSSSVRRKKSDKIQGNLNKSKKKFWSLKLRGKFPQGGRYSSHHGHSSDSPSELSRSNCPSHSNHRQDLNRQQDLLQSASNQILVDGHRIAWNSPLTLSANFDELYPTEDFDERRKADRAKEIREGIEFDKRSRSVSPTVSQTAGAAGPSNLLCQMFENRCSLTLTSYPALSHGYGVNSDYEESLYGELDFSTPLFPKVVHTQVDYIHCLVPELSHITNCSFYWGVMDRYEAEKLLENKPEGTFLLRDSAQDEFLFSVSFRRYNRSLHARIEQWNHKFSFDAHDPAVFATETVSGLIEHYKDPNCCMFFEPMLTLPLNRSFPFSLQHLCRSAISDHIAYDDIAYLPLPKALKNYITYYHYKQKVRSRRLDMPN